MKKKIKKKIAKTKVKRQGKLKKGKVKIQEYINFDLGKGEGSITFGERRVLIGGDVLVAYLRNDFECSDKIQIQVFGKDYKIQKVKENKKGNKLDIFIHARELDFLILGLQAIREDMIKHGV